MGRIWFLRPQWYWYGWSTLIPFYYGHDQYARRVLAFGWTVTGRIYIAVWNCGDPICNEDSARDVLIAKRAKRAKLGGRK